MGGIGFIYRDFMFEVISVFFDKEVLGFGELFCYISY